jgi:hypothetical protein
MITSKYNKLEKTLFGVSILASLLAGTFLILWLSAESPSKEARFAPKSSELIKRADAQRWVDKYTTQQPGKTQGVAFDFAILEGVMKNWKEIKDSIGGFYADQILVKFLIYDELINSADYTGDPEKQPGVLSVCLYPFNKTKQKLVDDSTSASRPLNLGDLYP